MKGHIYKRGATYTYVVDLGKDPITNKRRQKSKGGFRTKKEAQAALAEILTEYHRGTYINESEITLKEFVKKWLELYSSTGKVKISTIRVRVHETNNILKYFKQVKLKDITGTMYQDFLLYLNTKFAENTLLGIHRTARMIFKKAVELKYIKSDPTQYSVIPKKQKTVAELESEEEIPKYFEKEELLEFLDTVKKLANPQYYTIFLTLAYTGMRIGELCALKWKDIDFKDKEIKIYKTYYNPTNNTIKYTLLPPKTRTAKRNVSIDDTLIKELKKHKTRQNKLKLTSWHDEDFVFTKIINYPGYPETPKQIELKMAQILKKSNIATLLTPHGLRHTHASLLAQAGVRLQEIMDRLGHQDDNITRNIYLHVTKDMKKEALQKFSKLMQNL
ncbi:site-specific integrase [Crassaminicella thermophila]|uniref:site-specific integrase n=1 Tax=Crassaminicella thermophila TaxID=2599308 RepID=UPI001E5A23DA|nr:tyrosine-type recombinase/integrase [Crassaminicella thermophila]